MIPQRKMGFALLEVLLAVILMAIAAGASYTLVKSFRTNAATQQFLRYATNITQNYIPFLESEAVGGTSITTPVYKSNRLSQTFLTSIGIPSEDMSCTSSYCFVSSGMYSISTGTTASNQTMQFNIGTLNSTYYFVIGVKATGGQVNQVLQSASSLFSVFYTDGGAMTPSSEITTEPTKEYNLYLVFPKSGSSSLPGGAFALT